jgi:hypothetical protein
MEVIARMKKPMPWWKWLMFLALGLLVGSGIGVGIGGALGLGIGGVLGVLIVLAIILF